MTLRSRTDWKAILDRHLDGDFTVLWLGEFAPSESDIHGFEKEVGYSLPDDFKDFCVSPLGGLYVAANEDVWPRVQGGPYWRFLYGFMVYGLGDHIPEDMDLSAQMKEFRNSNLTKYVPFLKLISDGAYCFTEDKQVVKWNHETCEFEPMNRTFADLLDHELGALKARKERMKAQPSA